MDDTSPSAAHTDAPLDLDATLPARFLDTSSDPAFLAPILSPEFGLDQPVTGIASGYQTNPAVASDGDGYLVAWTDSRAPSWSTFATRVSADGAVLDSQGIFIGAGISPTIAFDGTNYLVVNRTATLNAAPLSFHGTRVSPDGVVLDPGGFTLGHAAGEYAKHDVAFDGTNFVVTWGQVATHLARVSPDGVVLDPDGIIVDASASGWQSAPSVASDGTSSLVVWVASDERIHGARIGPSGALLDPTALVIGPAVSELYGQSNPTVTFDGQNYVVAWTASLPATERCVVIAARVTPQGIVLDPTGVVVTEGSAWDSSFNDLNAAFDGQSTVFTWTLFSESPGHWIYRARFSPAGTVLDPGGVLLDSEVMQSSVASNGSGSLVAWLDGSASNGRGSNTVRGARLAQDGSLLDAPSLPLATSSNGQLYPAVTFNGESHLVLWSDDRNDIKNGSSNDIIGARVGPTGEVYDPSGIVIGAGPSLQTSPIAVFDGASTLVSWLSTSLGGDGDGDAFYNPQIARLTPTGQIVGPVVTLPFQTINAEAPPALASSGNGALLVLASGEALKGVAIAPSGTVGPVFSVEASFNTGFNDFTALASDGDGYLLVWGAAGEALFGARLTADGQTLDPGGFRITPVGAAIRSAQVAFDGDHYLVVWEDRASGGDGAVGAARVTPSGTVLDPLGIVVTPATNVPLGGWNGPYNDTSGTLPAVTCQAGHCLVAWRHRAASVPSDAVDIHAAVVDGAGTVSSSCVLADGPGPEGAPALSAGTVEALVAYSRFTASATTSSERILSRRVAWIPCTTSATCPSEGTCDEGVCVGPLGIGEGGDGTRCREPVDADPDAGGGSGCSVPGTGLSTSPGALLPLGALGALGLLAARRRRILRDAAQPQGRRRIR
ncbi:hypothetical protein [Chondromyces apiculatus]|uniref:Uncharacterized protein n=1 Tax=Chondromyces apiculatus DSM 436 TaxID=1192034 RepID=A0A017T948_9BACT|nr:hypothetical protein [Chondromyces apiculatus]EYF05467.1 Hypothetical protein CAP_3194 [Chondromyces apiculatus DSM 436]